MISIKNVYEKSQSFIKLYFKWNLKIQLTQVEKLQTKRPKVWVASWLIVIAVDKFYCQHTAKQTQNKRDGI